MAKRENSGARAGLEPLISSAKEAYLGGDIQLGKWTLVGDGSCPFTRRWVVLVTRRVWHYAEHMPSIWSSFLVAPVESRCSH